MTTNPKKWLSVFEGDLVLGLAFAAAVALQYFDKAHPLIWLVLIAMVLRSVFSFSLVLRGAGTDQPAEADDFAEAVDQALSIFTADSVRDMLRERLELSDEYDGCEPNSLAEAGGCYALADQMEHLVSGIPMKTSAFTRLWPWAPAAFTKREQRRNWVIAAAMLLAAIDQYDRAHSTTTQEDDHVEAE